MKRVKEMCSDTSKYLFFLAVFFECTLRMTTGLNHQICKDQSKCLILKDCKPYMDLLKTMERPLKTSVTDFLRSRECGFQEGYPKVCCLLLPKDLPIWKYASEPEPQINKTTIEPHKLSPCIKLRPVDNIVETTTKIPKYTPDELKKKSDAINEAFDLSELFDFTGSFDLFRRKRFNYNSNVDIEIR